MVQTVHLSVKNDSAELIDCVRDPQPITGWAHGTKSVLGVSGLKCVEKES